MLKLVKKYIAHLQLNPDVSWGQGDVHAPIRLNK